MKRISKILLFAEAALALVCIICLNFTQIPLVQSTGSRYVSLVTVEDSFTMSLTGANDTSYTVTLNKNGGTGGDDVCCVFKDSDISVVEIPENADKIFVGYFDAQEGGNVCFSANGVSVVPASTFETVTTVYAHWIDNN